MSKERRERNAEMQGGIVNAWDNADAKRCRREESMAIIPGNADEQSRNVLYGETRMRATYKKLEKQSKA